jgi:hypothetical protein
MRMAKTCFIEVDYEEVLNYRGIIWFNGRGVEINYVNQTILHSKSCYYEQL